MNQQTANATTTQRPVMTAPRRNGTGFKPNAAAGQQPKRPPQRNLEPHERILAGAKREGLTIEISLINEDAIFTGRVTDFGKYEIIIELKCGTRMNFFKSAIRSFHVIRGI